MSILPIYSVTPFTMLDFPDRTACIVWFSGCNMRCGYCHNPQIVKGKGRAEIEKVLDFLKKRQGLLDGVVLSGGEASLYPGLPDFINTIRKMNYAVKIDTNGTRPDIIRSFLEQGLLDYIAMDYKAPPEKMKAVAGISDFSTFHETLRMLCGQSQVPFEIRTTVHTGLMDEADIQKIIDDLDSCGYTGTYYIQNFKNDNDRPTLAPLPSQTRMLDTNKLRSPRGFQLSFRNF